MRISVAVIAFTEGQPLIARRAACVWRVALLALHLLVEARQRVARLGVIEFAGRIFPVHKVVARDAIRTQPSFVEVFVTGRAGLWNSQERLAQVLDLDVRPLSSWNSFRQMAFVALQPRVLAFEKVAGFLVVEFFRIPLDQRKIRPVVIGVAAYALLAGPGGNVVRRVEATLGGYARADVRMASNAAELRLAPADLVAVGAVHGAVKKLVLLCERAGRDLRVSLQGQCAKEKCADEIQQQP